MTAAERTFAVQYLEQTRDRVLAFAKSLSPAQHGHRPSAEHWSIAELLDHIIVVENWALGNIERALKDGVPDESRRGKGAHKDRLILDQLPARTIRAQAPPELHPSHRSTDVNELLRDFESTRNQVLHLARTTGADLRVLFAPHPMLKDLDAYQWLLLIASHAERHVRQAEESLTHAS